MAFGRSWNGKQFMTIDSVEGMMKAAPTPIAIRATMSWEGSSAALATRTAAPNTTSPSWRAPLRPKRSPRAPAGSSTPANTRAYASISHDSSVPEASRARWMVGRATFSELIATTIITRLMHNEARISQRRW
jgi:hypothetical protein